MSGSIRLHPEHGVNPTLGVCFFCGKEDGTIGLLGFNGDRKAPRQAVISREPCNTCKENMAKGITLLEANQRGEGMQVGERTWLSGRWLVVTEDWVRRSLEPAMRDVVLEKRKAYLDTETFNAIAPKEGE